MYASTISGMFIRNESNHSSINNHTHSHTVKEHFLHKLAHLDEDLFKDFYILWTVLMVINVLIFLTGVLLNSLALYVFCFRTKVKTSSVIYTINLIITDLLMGLSLPTRIIMYYSKGYCLTCSFMHIFSYFINMYCSILFLTCICVDRFLAIVQTESSRRWRNRNFARGLCVFIWIFAIVVTYSILTTAIRYSTCCLSKFLALAIFEFFLPLIIITIFTVRIMYALASPSLMQQSREKRQKAVQLLAIVLVIFLICFTPFHIRQVAVFIHPTMPHDVSLIIYHVTVTLSSLNSCLDPIVYCFVTNNFKSTLRGIFKKTDHKYVDSGSMSMQKSTRISEVFTTNSVMSTKITKAPVSDSSALL
ncbi:G-protein coupled receptor 20 [Protopterus annectens]|uniref:G-protein coupled receptor 20 n=1 Tax=Protopterus annectens TaxID=7888 RepID=UPI001CF9445C|nr:G-protein coupled receptor 20 [Protopterus annectens]